MNEVLERTEEKVVTKEFVDFMNSKILNASVKKDLTTYKENLDRFGNGNKIMAKGEGHIEKFVANNGYVKKILIENKYYLWYFDLDISYQYTSTTHGEYWACALGKCTFLNNEWGSVHPKGIMKARFVAEPSKNLQVKLEIQVDPDHNDNPGHFVRDRVIPLFREQVMNAAEEFTGLIIENLAVTLV
ncbi:hypothetical protein BXY41_11630 [Lacrimispora xylanisolvens]|uniref:Uncharacterized protein n=1 Tax=Lacrimispora xylanisolvens TaxID=384636 RepID=A0A2S6HJ56_9FIRM|nr:hypothetical protein [Hungatella xylanolytica]PPK77492.1 hypothetical protein BXY41_11630 [Hungatella xylanolytica]